MFVSETPSEQLEMGARTVIGTAVELVAVEDVLLQVNERVLVPAARGFTVAVNLVVVAVEEAGETLNDASELAADFTLKVVAFEVQVVAHVAVVAKDFPTTPDVEVG
jgi:hypothetical protein